MKKKPVQKFRRFENASLSNRLTLTKFIIIKYVRTRIFLHLIQKMIFHKRQ